MSGIKMFCLLVMFVYGVNIVFAINKIMKYVVIYLHNHLL